MNRDTLILLIFGTFGVAVGLIHLVFTERIARRYERQMRYRPPSARFWIGWSPEWTRNRGYIFLGIGLISLVWVATKGS